MKFVLKVGDKDLVVPEFKILGYKNREDIIVIAISGIEKCDFDMINQKITEEKFDIEMENSVLGLTIDNKMYVFDLEDYITYEDSHYLEDFKVAFTYIDANGTVSKENIVAIGMQSKC